VFWQYVSKRFEIQNGWDSPTPPEKIQPILADAASVHLFRCIFLAASFVAASLIFSAMTPKAEKVLARDDKVFQQ